MTIVSHDKFQEIVDHANEPVSLIRKGVIIDKNIPDETKKSVIVNSVFGAGISSPTEKEIKQNLLLKIRSKLKYQYLNPKKKLRL